MEPKAWRKPTRLTIDYGEIDRDIFEKIAGKLKEEIRFLSGDSESTRNKLSNPFEFIDHSLKICSNLSSLWVSGGYDQKVQLQDLLFPGGILFDKQKENYRTEKVNSILELTHSFTQALKGNKKGQIKNFVDLPALVAPAGIEPASSESESEILSIEIRSHNTTTLSGADRNLKFYPRLNDSQHNFSSNLTNHTKYDIVKFGRSGHLQHQPPSLRLRRPRNP